MAHVYAFKNDFWWFTYWKSRFSSSQAVKLYYIVILIYVLRHLSLAEFEVQQQLNPRQSHLRPRSPGLGSTSLCSHTCWGRLSTEIFQNVWMSDGLYAPMVRFNRLAAPMFFFLSKKVWIHSDWDPCRIAEHWDPWQLNAARCNPCRSLWWWHCPRKDSDPPSGRLHLSFWWFGVTNDDKKTTKTSQPVPSDPVTFDRCYSCHYLFARVI